MQRTKRYLARLLALAAIAAVAIAVVVIVSSFKGESNDKTARHGSAHPAKQQPAPHKTKAKTYTIQSGDTLTAIAHKTGLKVQEIQALNPEVDPQILIAGEVLKLR
jgi:LysM repeat protein